jgi:hypothetical protein
MAVLKIPRGGLVAAIGHNYWNRKQYPILATFLNREAATGAVLLDFELDIPIGIYSSRAS